MVSCTWRRRATRGSNLCYEKHLQNTECWHQTRRIHGFVLLTQNSQPAVNVSQQKPIFEPGSTPPPRLLKKIQLGWQDCNSATLARSFFWFSGQSVIACGCCTPHSWFSEKPLCTWLCLSPSHQTPIFKSHSQHDGVELGNYLSIYLSILYGYTW